MNPTPPNNEPTPEEIEKAAETAVEPLADWFAVDNNDTLVAMVCFKKGVRWALSRKSPVSAGPVSDAAREPTNEEFNVAAYVHAAATGYASARIIAEHRQRAIDVETAALRGDIAAIQAGLTKEFTNGGKPSGDLIDDFECFINHHAEVETERNALRAALRAVGINGK